MYTKLTISERLKDLRVERHLTLEQLAERTGISKAALGKYETEDFKDISPFSISTLAKFYGVSTDYLMGLTEQKNHPNTELNALHLSDDAIEILKGGQFNSRLLSEIICHKGFQRLMADMEIYVDRLASMQIDNLNAYIETARRAVLDQYQPDENETYFRTLELARINEDEYFSQTFRDDLTGILRDIRDAHRKDRTTAPETSPAEDFQKSIQDMIAAKGSTEEKTVRTYLAGLGIDYDSLTPEEVVTQIGILRKSKYMKDAVSRRGRSSPAGKKHRK